MSGSEWAAVVAAQVCLVLLVVLVVVIVRLDRAARDLRNAAADFRAEAEPALEELRRVVRAADFELDRVDAILSGAERVGDRVDAASDLAYRTFTNPVVKALAVGTGTRRAVQRLKGDKPAKRDGRRASMFKRATWLGVGFTLGVGTTVVAARKARQQLDRYKPNAMVDRVTTSITDKTSALRNQLADAIADGRQAAKTREDELRAAKPKLHAVDADVGAESSERPGAGYPGSQ